MRYYFEHYDKLREQMREAAEREEWTNYAEYKQEYLYLCQIILEKLMENNSDVLRRLKG